MGLWVIFELQNPGSLRKYSLTLSLLLVAAFAAAQTRLQFSFTHYTSDAGLLTDRTNSVVQDEQGFIWIASADGLQRFDGVRYKTFRHIEGDASSIPSKGVFQLMPGDHNILWMLCTEGHIGTFNTKTFRYQEVKVVSRMFDAGVNLAVSRLRKDDQGNIFFVLNAEELLTWNSSKNEFSKAWNFFQAKDEWKITDFIQQPATGKYYIGIKGLGFAMYNKTTGKLSYPGNNTEDDPLVAYYGSSTVNTYNRFLIDSKQRFWFMSWPVGFPYIHCFDLAQKKIFVENTELISTLKEYHTISGFFEQKDGSIWTTGMMVLARFDEASKKFSLVKNSGGYHSLKFNDIFFLWEDQHHNIWVPTLSHGLYRFNPSKEYFTNIAHSGRRGSTEGNGSVNALFLLKDGTWLSDAWGDGMYRYDKDLREIPLRIQGIADINEVTVWCMAASHDSNIVWMGGQPGIYKYNQQLNSITSYLPEKIGRYTIRQVAEDKNGNLWIGTHDGGIFKWDAEKGKNDFNAGIEKIEFSGKNVISKIICDSRNRIWAGTDHDGCYVIDAVSSKLLLHFSPAQPAATKLPEDGVSSVLEYNDSIVILTTSQKLLMYNNRQQQLHTLPLPDNFSGYFSALEKDRQGFLWISTSAGLYRYGPNGSSLLYFGKKDGIEETNFGVAASYKTPDGRIFFGSDGKAILFDPEKINNRREAVPQVQLTDFIVANQNLQVDSLLQLKEIELGYRENVIEIGLSSMDPDNSFDIYYMLEGTDKDWRLAGKIAMAVYSYLNPGSYTFRVKAVNNHGLAGEETRIIIHIQPPFWKTWWFYSLLLLAAGGVLLWYDRERMQRKEALQKMRTDIAGNLHQEISTALGNINILSEMARLKADTDPEKSKEFIEQIHSKSHNMIIAMDDMLWSIDPANDNMEKTVLRMKEYIASLTSRHHVAIELLVDERINKLNLNMQLRHDAFLLFKESIKKLVQAGAADCRIYIGPEKNYLLYSLQYSNEHCDMQQITNLLHSQEMQKQMHAINATMQFDVQKSFSLLTVKIPLQ